MVSGCVLRIGGCCFWAPDASSATAVRYVRHLALQWPGTRQVRTATFGGALPLVAVAVLVAGLLAAHSPVALVTIPLAAMAIALLDGYYLRILRRANDDDGPREFPPFTEPVQLARDGVLAIAISAVYLTPTLIALGWGIARLVGAGALRPGVFDLTAVARVAAVPLLGVLGLGLAYLYVYPIAWTLFVLDGRPSAAFDLRRVLAVATSRTYAIAWSEATSLGIAGGSASVPLHATPVGPPMAFAVRVATYRMLGPAVSEALEDRRREAEAVGPL